MSPLSHILPPLSAATLLSASVCLPLPVGLFHSVLHSPLPLLVPPLGVLVSDAIFLFGPRGL